MPRRHVVQQGECLSSIAARYGFASWKTIYDDPSNASFRTTRPNPHVILPGDELTIPELPEARLDLATGSAHSLAVERPATLLRLSVLDHAGGQGVQARYRLEVSGVPDAITGTIGADGILDAEVPAGARKARLVLTAPDDESSVLETMDLAIGDLDPPEEASGVRERLRRTGFDPGPEGDELDRRTEEALRAFQRRYGLDETGTATPATRDKLKELAGA